MKRIIFFIISFVLICFVIPIIFTSKFRTLETKVELPIDEEKNNIEIYDYGQYTTVKLLHVSTGEIEELGLDQYLYGVVSSEMPANFEEEALKAQAVVARTYTIYKITNGSKHENANICDDSKCCQAWISKEARFEKWNKSERENNWSKIVNAVDSTKGKIITYDGKPINAFFHSNSGGKTEIASSVWGGKDEPYLQAVETSGEGNYTQYSSEVILTKSEFVDKIKQYHSNFEIDFSNENQIEILEYTEGQRIKTIKLGNLELTGTEIRNIFGLKSAKFEISVDGENVKFKVIGYGHGVGMSQTGADSMAKEGKNYEEIIKHYYTGVEIVNL